ncbi:uncharacterized protein LOC123563739 [Mercenaria mercenaria]|uniref:uncharacterized protein LOC123563739 n=1 Tax=Mercenaria mercenaria TaxID=6596 RepID=UPI00234F0F4B|nr:uncharacterized protein LOC123563739 [Mercenaria mercenaria]
MSCFDYKWKVFLGSILVCMVLLATTVYRSYSDDKEPSPREWSNKLPFLVGNIAKSGTKDKITLLAKVIHNAKKYVRGSKTSDYLHEAISIMNYILQDINLDAERLYERSGAVSTSVCPETFKGGSFGFPLYYKGFETDDCGNNVSLSNTVTVIKYIDTKPTDEKSSSVKLDQFLSSVYYTLDKVSTFIAVGSTTLLNNLNTKYQLVKVVQSNDQSAGSALNSIIREVKTPYVLVARDIKMLTSDSRLERLIMELESLNVVAVGGSFRDSNGRWKKGCFQTVYRNYTLKYIEGYDESFHECLFCDYVQGPFVTTTEYLKQNSFQNMNENDGLYEDWFLRMFQKGKEIIVCPDSMFHVDGQVQIVKTESDWKQFAQNWNLFEVLTPKGYTFTRGCKRQDTSSRPSQALSPCAVQKINNGIKTIMRICEEIGVICELEEGTAIGAVKFGKVLPWDLDFDLRFLATNCSKCKQLESAFKTTADLNIARFSSSCCNKKLKPGERDNFAIYYQGYYGDFTAFPALDSDILSKAGIAPTKILFDGQWVNVPRNPGMFVRNRYGKEIYQHAEHWRYTSGRKTSSMINYTTNTFLPCKEPGWHDCLDRYNADGDLQFVEMLP